MANFGAMFAGCESFMEGDVEINNDVTVPAGDGVDALTSENEAADLGAEGAEAVADSDTEVAEGEAANMVFDQVLAMYDHVKNYGIDRTFLSLYNDNGQLDNMIGYRFPSCESIDVVGSPRSSASRAFIAAMEDDGIWRKIWEWIKKVCTAIANFFIKVADWFREAMGNLDIRIGKLRRELARRESETWDKVKDKQIKSSDEDDFKKMGEKLKIIQKVIVGSIDNATLTHEVSYTFAGGHGWVKGEVDTGSGGGSYGNVNQFPGGVGANTKATLIDFQELSTVAMDQAVKSVQGAASEGALGKDDFDKYSKKVKDKKHFDEVDQAKHFAKKVQDVIDKYEKQVNKIGSKSEDVKDAYLPASYYSDTLQKYTEAGFDPKAAIDRGLSNLAAQHRNNLSVRQFIDRMKLNIKHMEQNAQTGYRMCNGESMTREASEQGRKATQCFNVIINVRVKALNICEKFQHKVFAILTNHLDKLTKPSAAGGARGGASTVTEEEYNKITSNP